LHSQEEADHAKHVDGHSSLLKPQLWKSITKELQILVLHLGVIEPGRVRQNKKRGEFLKKPTNKPS
jgi:hypothetical protein